MRFMVMVRATKTSESGVLPDERLLADMGKRPTPKHAIDRYTDTNGHYEPGNCRWTTQKEQQRNRRNNRLVTFRGKTQCLNAWSEEIGIQRQTLGYRLSAGWTEEEAFTITPRDRGW